MPRTIRTKVYKFNELSDSAKEKAIQWGYDLNVDHEWWESMYEDAEIVGIKINGFDIDRASYVDADFKSSAYETAGLIIVNHGEQCETYKTAFSFIQDYDKLVQKHSDGIKIDVVSEDNEYEFDGEAEELESDFKKAIQEDYRILLTKEYEYLTSREAIIEAIEANEYEFTIDGKRF